MTQKEKKQLKFLKNYLKNYVKSEYNVFIKMK